MTPKVDPASTLYNLLARYLDDRITALRVGLPCKVIAFDTDSATADIQPLTRTSKTDPAMLHSVPVLSQRYHVHGGDPQVYTPVLYPGDVVFAVCADRELQNVKSGNVASPDTNRSHSVNDAVIVGVFGWNL
ncbi:hypothetical protein J2Z69_003650 [Paenibacillus shirakamiensis]|uniref:Phage protein Gp138 N-terminal domain-containing protein n=1 Tax=Paenibacillus shirakamiensis TaxID=1265935 RepID=A0ABS4JLH4_9BACL|nr:Gp138 family membrane-puncturing spike protein [Paenibacillus shirakamiensis]MBP2002564.1 hypothetical protein [Paenibacillus shirakamiensis]